MTKYIIAFIVLVSSFVVTAQPPYGPDMIRTPSGIMNEWEITLYQDHDSGLINPSVHRRQGTQRLCFYYAGVVDSHQRYYVVSSTYPGWIGNATQEGDLVRIKMTFWNGRGNDEILFDLATMGPKDRGMGHWDETVETWSTFGWTLWGNTELTRVGRCNIISNGLFKENENRLAEEAHKTYPDKDSSEDNDWSRRTPMYLNYEEAKRQLEESGAQ